MARSARSMARAIPFPARQIALLSFLLAATALLAGCNTVEGVGEDVQSGGRTISRSVQ